MLSFRQPEILTIKTPTLLQSISWPSAKQQNATAELLHASLVYFWDEVAGKLPEFGQAFVEVAKFKSTSAKLFALTFFSATRM
jgi:hypothetical protein